MLVNVSLGTMLRVTPVKDAGDSRGHSFPLGDQIGCALPAVRDAHFATILPGCVRGNHYHRLRREVLVVFSEGSWTLAWDEGEGTQPCERRFNSAEAVVVQIEPGASHAIRNDGECALFVISLSDGIYSETNPDAYPRQLLSAVKSPLTNVT
jgi:dTDP-4-dehydrorhamnose 3,5-epimerase-like enzyme